MKHVAVIGSGISGLSAAWALARAGEGARVTLFEAADYAGGHTHTVDVTLNDANGNPVTHGVDTGFLVFNHRTYPQLVELFKTLDVPTAPSDMSFSVQAEQGGLEWCGTDLNGVFAQRSNIFKPSFWLMLREILRFNKEATRLAETGTEVELTQSIEHFLDSRGYTESFRRWYLLPMISSIWSCPAGQMLQFPVSTLIRFCHNHGLLQVNDRPQWYTVSGGARQYVQRMLKAIPDVRLNTPVTAVRRNGPGAGVTVFSPSHAEHFDDVVFACHSDQTLRILGQDARPAEQAVLSAIPYQDNHAVLHTDTALLPKRRLAWAAWNYEHRDAQDDQGKGGVCLHYLLNRLQPLPFAQDVIVSLNPIRQPDPGKVIAHINYAHPAFDLAARDAQEKLPSIQGENHTWFCGAWTGYGFHEDGLKSGLAVAQALQARWRATANLPQAA